MGGYVSKSISDTMASKQQEMAANQQRMMRENTERMQRMQMAMQMSVTRERLNWMFGTYGLLLLGAARNVITKQPIPGALMGPLFVLPITIAYQMDLAYFNKADRIRAEFLHILDNEDHWFSIAERESRAANAATNVANK